MRYAILGDIHGNLTAFRTVLDALKHNGGFDKILCLGDIIGYGPEPHECVELLRSYEHICVAGNHDWACTGKISIDDFNSNAIEACKWTGNQLVDDDVQYLHSLPEIAVISDFTLAHGSPRDPVFEYILSEITAEDNFKQLNTPFCLVGHTHIPLIFEKCDEDIEIHEFHDGDVFPLGDSPLIINPGSVGQPRDEDPRCSYIIYDSEKNAIFLHRVEYDIGFTQQKMKEAGLPDFLISRLSYGW